MACSQFEEIDPKTTFNCEKPLSDSKHNEERHLDLELYLPYNKTVSLKTLYIKP